MTIVQTDIVDLGRKQAQLFMANNVAYSEILVTCSIPRYILVCVYRKLIRERKFIAIEDMLLEQKETAWQTAKDIAKGRLGRTALIEVVQALLVIEYFLNL